MNRREFSINAQVGTETDHPQTVLTCYICNPGEVLYRWGGGVTVEMIIDMSDRHRKTHHGTR